MEDILVATFKDLKGYARYLENPYESYSIDFLANQYIKAKKNKDEFNKNVYSSALLLRYWHKINKLYDANRNLNLEKYEFFNWLWEAIEYACKYHAWTKKGSRVNANQAINQCISTIRSQHYYQYNLDKHKSNMNVMSLNSKMDDDEKTEFLDNLEDESESPELMQQRLAVDMLIQRCINENKVVESIIVDIMRSNDCEKVVKKASFVKDAETGKRKKVIKTTTEFWPFKVVKLLGDLPVDYKEQFERKYDIKDSILTVALERLAKANNSRKYQYLDRTLKTCKSMMGVI